VWNLGWVDVIKSLVKNYFFAFCENFGQHWTFTFRDSKCF
jgi:hypothetical protein